MLPVCKLHRRCCSHGNAASAKLWVQPFTRVAVVCLVSHSGQRVSGSLGVGDRANETAVTGCWTISDSAFQTPSQPSSSLLCPPRLTLVVTRQCLDALGQLTMSQHHHTDFGPVADHFSSSTNRNTTVTILTKHYRIGLRDQRSTETFSQYCKC